MFFNHKIVINPFLGATKMRSFSTRMKPTRNKPRNNLSSNLLVKLKDLDTVTPVTNRRMESIKLAMNHSEMEVYGLNILSVVR